MYDDDKKNKEGEVVFMEEVTWEYINEWWGIKWRLILKIDVVDQLIETMWWEDNRIVEDEESF